jgi:hypothetical protein
MLTATMLARFAALAGAAEFVLNPVRDRAGPAGGVTSERSACDSTNCTWTVLKLDSCGSIYAAESLQ